MREYFKGWRRKFGCVALALACVFASGWVRSFTKTDWLSLSDRGVGRSPLKFVSSEGSIAILPMKFSTVREAIRVFTLQLPDVYSREAISIEKQPGVWFTWHWKRGGFAYASERSAGGRQPGRYLMFVLPYWSVVLPLTLVSAYLIVSKPRKRVEASKQR